MKVEGGRERQDEGEGLGRVVLWVGDDGRFCKFSEIERTVVRGEKLDGLAIFLACSINSCCFTCPAGYRLLPVFGLLASLWSVSESQDECEGYGFPNICKGEAFQSSMFRLEQLFWMSFTASSKSL